MPGRAGLRGVPRKYVTITLNCHLIITVGDAKGAQRRRSGVYRNANVCERTDE
jgi:hypothetical protein